MRNVQTRHECRPRAENERWSPCHSTLGTDSQPSGSARLEHDGVLLWRPFGRRRQLALRARRGRLCRSLSNHQWLGLTKRGRTRLLDDQHWRRRGIDLRLSDHGLAKEVIDGGDHARVTQLGHSHQQPGERPQMLRPFFILGKKAVTQDVQTLDLDGMESSSGHVGDIPPGLYSKAVVIQKSISQHQANDEDAGKQLVLVKTSAAKQGSLEVPEVCVPLDVLPLELGGEARNIPQRHEWHCGRQRRRREDGGNASPSIFSNWRWCHADGSEYNVSLMERMV
jgi:hypothetical protein